MASWATWLIGMAAPLAKRVLAALGIGTLTYAALTPLLNSVINSLQTTYGQIGGTTAALLAIAGIPSVLGIIAGALVARVSFIAVGKLGKIAS